MYSFSDNGVAHQAEDEINYLFKLLVVEVECGSSLISDILFLNFNYVSGLNLICILTTVGVVRVSYMKLFFKI